MKLAYLKDLEIQRRISAHLGVDVALDDCRALRRAALTLHRWGELECGDGNDYKSWSIERDEDTDIPYFCTYPHDSNKVSRTRIPDREKGALKRVAAICERLGLHFYHQTDPRGWPLYIDKEPLPDNNYSRGVGIGE